MIVVTGAAGFIGSNIIKGLNQSGRRDILAVDDLSDGKKYRNLASVEYADYLDYEDFLQKVLSGAPEVAKIKVIFHEGACSDTTEWNGRYMMRNNYEYSKSLLHYCLQNRVQFIYASSGAVYGAESKFSEAEKKLMPLNVYGYSKWKLDQYVWPYLEKNTSQIVGLRYFNVYGPQEQHKGKMASVAFHLMNQLRDAGIVRLFAGSHGYADGEHLRDFVYVDDVVKVNLWFMQHADKRGIFNVGTGNARPFNEVAQTLLKLHGKGELQYIPFPESLRQAYQAYTEADISALRAAGYKDEFESLQSGLTKYYQWFQQEFFL